MKRLSLFFLIIYFCGFSLYGETAISFYNKAESYFENNNYSEALYYYKKSLEKNKYFTKSLYKLALINLKLNNRKEADKYLKRLVRISPNNTKALIILADLNLQNNKKNKALKIYKKVLKKEPLNYDAFVGLGKVYIEKKFFAYAKKNLQRAIKINKEFPEAYLIFAKLYIKENKIRKAESFIKKALYYGPDNPKVYFYFGLIETQKNNLKNAVGYYLKAYELNNNDYSVILNLLDVYFKLKDWDNSNKFLTKAIEKFPNLSILYYKRALANMFNYDYKKSFADFKKSLSLNSNNDLIRFIYETDLINHSSFYNPDRMSFSRIHIKRAHQYENKNLLNDALYEYKRGLRLFSERWDDRYALARLYKKMGLLDLYLRELKIAFSLNKNKKELKYKYDIAVGFRKKRLAYKLGIKQYDISKNKVKFMMVNFKPKNNDFIHNHTGKIIADSISFYLRGINKFEKYNLSDNKYYFYKNRNEIAKVARENGFDYYAYGFYKEKKDSLYLEFDIYSVTRDESIKKIKAVGGGKYKLYELTKSVAEKLDKVFITEGKIISVNNDYIIINLGLADGIKLKDKIDIYDFGGLNKDFTYSQFFKTLPKKKASATIYKIDEQIALAKVKGDSSEISINDKVKIVRKKK